MRKTLSILTVSFFALSLMGFKEPAVSDYGAWKSVSCFRGLDFCVKKASYNEYAKKYEWWVKFRNRYQETVSFDFTAKESYVNTAKTTDRISVRPGGENGSWFLLAEESSVNVFVDHLRFGQDDWGTKYAACDY